MSSPTNSAVVVVTGLSGAGKTTALCALADIGYYCVDNLPPALVSETVRVCEQGGISRIALCIDIRVGAFLETALDAIEALQARQAALTVLFLDARDDGLVRRFSETRRPHPMLAKVVSEGDALSVGDGVRLERARLAAIRSHATLVVDTTRLSVHELRRQVIDSFSGSGSSRPQLVVRVESFGFKHGLPLDADLVFDVRFLDNPHFVPTLRELTGADEPVRRFVLESPGCDELLVRILALLEYCLPRYESEGKSYLTVAVGCTGGQHRSVAIAAELGQRLSAATGRRVAIEHRDVARAAIVEEVAQQGDGRRRGRSKGRAAAKHRRGGRPGAEGGKP